MKQVFFVLGCLILFVSSCKQPKSKLDIPSPAKVSYGNDTLTLSREEKYDKILGALVGSAIGDAMGASTEMWHRKDIQLKYAYINGLTAAVREQSPEGTWDHNLNAGATTDDTRWKFLMVEYLKTHKKRLNAQSFAKFISDYYELLAKDLARKEISTNPDVLDTKIEKIDWIKEWARVALAYQKGDTAYQKAQNRFYGGEMSCAGQLYTPMFGLVAENPEDAYNIAYEHALFDIGYAKDISALVSAMTQMAMQTRNMDSIINTATFVDPLGYQDSRLVGRISNATANASVKSVLAIKAKVVIDSLIEKDSILYKMPKGFQGTQKDWVRQEMVYQMLEKDEKAIAFHTGEIWQILITGLQFGEGDFEKTMQFIVNYGRDNDTVAAIAGMILGAKDGYSNLPEDLKEEVVKVSREQMGIDLEVMAKELVN
ncbi:ADP-ribosylglycohydrolase family protein [Maribacter algarum]|uniref:ADP-ribosylglycohydrolase family protein n=1 Tax=Maribacter algarum (ex Zhang et al. 2020) TaxID=2578118 RepID=A0A5S3PX25_9FLAO|nr:ADP-ribosylglycohydrolase family protein [Maribacter algarum]TMM59468.1 ADP-ribosylglycohydrolase family protein [Maribacter algarum]